MSIIKSNGAGESGGFYNGAVSTSLRFDRASAHYLSRDQGSAGNQKVFTLAFWVKRGIIGVADTALFGTQSDGNNRVYMRWEADDTFKVYFAIGGTAYDNGTTMKFRDTSAWYHVAVVVNMAGSGDTGKLKIYVNGVNQTMTYNSTLPDANIAMCAGVAETLGKKDGASNYMDGYLADVYLIDGTAVGETSGYLDEFGEVKKGIWIPKKYTGSYGTNGFHLEFTSSAHDAPASEGSADTDNIGADSSGQNHHWTAVDSISAHDCAIPDCPENTFCTLNQIENDKKFADSNQALMTQSEGSLKFSGGRNVFGTIAVTSGKWYWEIINTSSTVNSVSVSGVVTHGTRAEHYAVYYNRNGNKGIGIMASGATESSYGATYTDDDIIGVALNMDDNQVTFFKNNADQGTITDAKLATGEVHAWTQNGNNSGTLVGVYNFGQDASFAGQITAGTATDGSGKGVFKYAPPSGFLALCSANLPKATIGPDSTTQANDHFGILTYTGNGSGPRSIVSGATGIGGELSFKPDWLWVKSRNTTYYHGTWDSSRTNKSALYTNAADNEDTSTAGTLGSLDDNGFTTPNVGSGGFININSSTYVAWNWKANGGTTTTNDASATSVGATDSVIQANTTAGFSIVTYTGTGSATTIAHGLGGVPEVMIIKNRDGDHGWSGFYHHLMAGTAAASATDYLTLNGTGNLVDDNTIWNDTPPTSTVFTVGTANNTGSTDAFVGYFFRGIEGYSKFGSYTGNGEADGVFVFTGFRPRYVLLKAASLGSQYWNIFDSERDPFNDQASSPLYANATDAEGNGNVDIDLLSNGMKMRDSGNNHNSSGHTYIYLAFAEAPFKFANAR